MVCHHVHLPGGATAIVCGPKQNARCSRCRAPGILLCDFPVADGKTCDKPMCPKHAVEVGPDRHYCPECMGDKPARRKKAAPSIEPVKPPICPYCSKPAKLFVDSSSLYRSGVNYGPAWACTPCGAWVGTHKNSKRHVPLGRLANAELRKAKIAAHAAFDPLWQGKMRRDGCSKQEARVAAYAWLAGQMGIEKKDCHVGMFDVEQCNRVIEICQAVFKKVPA
jgi:hypothetical protein